MLYEISTLYLFCHLLIAKTPYSVHSNTQMYYCLARDAKVMKNQKLKEFDKNFCIFIKIVNFGYVSLKILRADLEIYSVEQILVAMMEDALIVFLCILGIQYLSSYSY